MSGVASGRLTRWRMNWSNCRRKIANGRSNLEPSPTRMKKVCLQTRNRVNEWRSPSLLQILLTSAISRPFHNEKSPLLSGFRFFWQPPPIFTLSHLFRLRNRSPRSQCRQSRESNAFPTKDKVANWPYNYRNFHCHSCLVSGTLRKRKPSCSVKV